LSANDNLIKKQERMSELSYQQKADLIIARKQNENSCTQEEYHKISADKNKLITELTETRAAMLSYKNMCNVIAN